MKSIAKNNFITILSKFKEDCKNFSSKLNEKLDNEDLSLSDFSESDPDIIDELIKSDINTNKQGRSLVSTIGIPSKPKVPRESTKVTEPTIIKPITNRSISNNRNISLIHNNNEIERD